jgi:hypothetical protein
MTLAIHSQLWYSALHGNKKENPQISHFSTEEACDIFSNVNSLKKGGIKSSQINREIKSGQKEE